MSGTITLSSIKYNMSALIDEGIMSVIPADFTADLLALCEKSLTAEMFKSIEALIEANKYSDIESYEHKGQVVAVYIANARTNRAIMSMIKALLPSDASDAIKAHPSNYMIPLSSLRGEYVDA